MINVKKRVVSKKLDLIKLGQRMAASSKPLTVPRLFGVYRCKFKFYIAWKDNLP